MYKDKQVRTTDLRFLIICQGRHSQISSAVGNVPIQKSRASSILYHSCFLYLNTKQLHSLNNTYTVEWWYEWGIALGPCNTVVDKQTISQPERTCVPMLKIENKTITKIISHNVKCFVENKRRWCNSEWDEIGEQATSARGQGGMCEKCSLWGTHVRVETEEWEVSHRKTWIETVPEKKDLR